MYELAVHSLAGHRLVGEPERFSGLWVDPQHLDRSVQPVRNLTGALQHRSGDVGEAGNLRFGVDALRLAVEPAAVAVDEGSQRPDQVVGLKV